MVPELVTTPLGKPLPGPWAMRSRDASGATVKVPLLVTELTWSRPDRSATVPPRSLVKAPKNWVTLAALLSRSCTVVVTVP